MPILRITEPTKPYVISEKFPLRVGLKIPEKTRDYVYVRKNMFGKTTQTRYLGKTIVKVAKNNLSKAFVNVEEIVGGQSLSGMDGTVELSLVEFSYRECFYLPKLGEYRESKAVFKAVLYDKSGNKLLETTEFGLSYILWAPFILAPALFEPGFNPTRFHAIEDAITKLIGKIQEFIRNNPNMFA